MLGMPEQLTLADLRQQLDVPEIPTGLVQPALKTIVEALISLERRVHSLEQARQEDNRAFGR
jgi:hypothetical protein